MASSFCPKCGTPRAGAFRFCRTCGLDLDAIPSTPSAAPVGWSAQVTVPPGVAAAGTDPATYRLLTMLAWLASAIALAWLGLIQLGFVGTLIDDGSLGPVAIWNLLMAVLIGYGAVRLQRSPKRSSFRQSAIWAVVIVLLQGIQIVGGATHMAYVLATAAAAGAGILAWLAYQAMPADAQ